ncbi:hypothetical protein XENOCAPTIV_015955, partial [Xenoophorus captivus]
GGAEQQQRHVAVGCDVTVVLMHYDFADGACLGMRPRYFLKQCAAVSTQRLLRIVPPQWSDDAFEQKGF